MPDELADESFTVYDHPKVLFFENTKRLPAEAIEKALLSATPSKTLTRDDLLLAHPAAAAATSTAETAEPGRGVPGLRSSSVALLLFAAWLELTGLAGAGLLAFLLPARPGRDALGRVTGVLLFAFVPWLLVSWRFAPFTRGLLVVTTAALLSAGFLCRRRAREATPTPERRKTALVFWGTFLFFLAVRALNPEIYSGEKPMDFSFLNTLLRSTELPPPEPWLAGTPLSYTYFGHFVAAAAGKLLGIHPGILFNLAIAMTAALSASAILAAGAALGGRLRTGAVAVLLALFVAPPSGPRTAFDFHFHQAGRALDWHYFWATSRVIQPNAINEYPFWSFLFADLHAHVLALPFTAAFVAALLLFVTREDRARPRSPPVGRARRARRTLFRRAADHERVVDARLRVPSPLPARSPLARVAAAGARGRRRRAREERPRASGGSRPPGGAPRASVLGAVLAAAAELGPRGRPVGAAVGLLQRVGALHRAPRAVRLRRMEEKRRATREGRARVPDPRSGRAPAVSRVLLAPSTAARAGPFRAPLHGRSSFSSPLGRR